MGLKKMLEALGRSTKMIGYGCMGISEFYGPIPNKKDAIALIKKAYQEFDVVFFDTADMYGKGLSEEILGEAIAPFRHKVIVGTKCGLYRTDAEIGKGITMDVINTPQYIKEACNKSLERLGTDYIDIYYLHRHDGITPIEDIMHAMQELIAEGKIRSIGLSEVNIETIRRAHAVVGDDLVAVQTEYSFNTRQPIEEILTTCRELDITIIPYSPIARGLLSGAIRRTSMFGNTGFYDFRADLPRFSAGNIEKNLELVDAVSEIAKRKNCTPAQLALAWLLAQGDDIIPIPGTSNQNHLKENVLAQNIELSVDDIQELDRAYYAHPPAGSRMPEEALKQFNLTA